MLNFKELKVLEERLLDCSREVEELQKRSLKSRESFVNRN